MRGCLAFLSRSGSRRSHVQVLVTMLMCDVIVPAAGLDIPVRRQTQLRFGMRLTPQSSIKGRSPLQVSPSHFFSSFLPSFLLPFSFSSRSAGSLRGPLSMTSRHLWTSARCLFGCRTSELAMHDNLSVVLIRVRDRCTCRVFLGWSRK